MATAPTEIIGFGVHAFVHWPIHAHFRFLKQQFANAVGVEVTQLRLLYEGVELGDFASLYSIGRHDANGVTLQAIAGPHRRFRGAIEE